MDLRQADIELSEFMDSPTFSRLKIKLLVADPVEVRGELCSGVLAMDSLHDLRLDHCGRKFL